MKQADPFKNILRYGLDPFNGLEENLKQLEIFIRESGTNEVMFLLMPEAEIAGKQFQCLKNAAWEPVSPSVRTENGVATLTFDLETPVLESAFIFAKQFHLMALHKTGHC